MMGPVNRWSKLGVMIEPYYNTTVTAHESRYSSSRRRRSSSIRPFIYSIATTIIGCLALKIKGVPIV